jgi:dihydropteroate synthase
MARPLIMGVVNVTPDSFSDGYPDPGQAIAHGRRLAAEGADLLDIGGEATSPRARPISADEELARVLPVVRELAKVARVSIDTTKAMVARAAVSAGATIINDVSGGLFDPGMSEALAELKVTYICGHLRGRSIADVFADENRSVHWTEVAAELSDRISSIPPGIEIWVDPGIGFGKGADPATNEALVRHAGDLGRTLHCPVVVGPSRKRYLRRRLIDAGTPEPTLADLDRATVAECLAATAAGANVLRVHNVALLDTGLAAYNKE